MSSDAPQDPEGGPEGGDSGSPEPATSPGEAEVTPADVAAPNPGQASPEQAGQAAPKKKLTRRRLLGLAALGGLAYGTRKLFWIDAPPRLDDSVLAPAGAALYERVWEASTLPASSTPTCT